MEAQSWRATGTPLIYELSENNFMTIMQGRSDRIRLAFIYMFHFPLPSRQPIYSADFLD